MKIIQILPYSYTIHPGGLEKIADTLGRGLSQQFGYEVIGVASDIYTQKMKHQKSNTENIVSGYEEFYMPAFDIVAGFPMPKIRNKQYKILLDKIKFWKPDCIVTHTRFFLQSFLGGLLAKMLGCKWVHIEHGSGFVTGYPRYIRTCAWLFDWTIGLWIFRQCDAIVTISQSHKMFIKKFTNKEPIVIYNPIEFTPQEKIENAIPHIGFVGRLVPLKGINLLVDALFELQDKQRQSTIVGDGIERKNLEEQVLNHGLEDRIKFVGADDRSNWLHKFDVLVNPSYQEGLPTTVVEGLLAGCIVIATDVGGTREISNEADLIMIKTDSVSELTQSLEKVLHPDYRQHIIGASQSIIEEKFTKESSIRAYKNLFDAIIQNK